MNKIYRLKFSKRLNQLVAVSEITTGHDKNSGTSSSVEVSQNPASKAGGLLKIAVFLHSVDNYTPNSTP